MPATILPRLCACCEAAARIRNRTLSDAHSTATLQSASLTGQTFRERDCVGRRPEQQDRVVGRGDAISHYQWVEVDRLTGRDLLLRCRLVDAERTRREMLAGLRPRQGRVVLRVAGLADEDDHVPHRRPFAGALDEIPLEEVMGRR